jgi:hypothetical protein
MVLPMNDPPAPTDTSRTDGFARTRWRPSRRQFLGTVGLAVLGAACSSSNSGSNGGTSTASSSGGPTTLAGLAKGASQVSVLSSTTPVSPGKVRFAFALSTQQGVLTGGAPQVWAAKTQTSPASGPSTASWHPFTAYEVTHDTSPKSPLPGTYTAEVTLPSAGNWVMGVQVPSGSGMAFGTAAQPVAPNLPNPVGSKATSTPTPVATTNAAIAQICTRKPVDHMHAISLDAALKNGKPTVVVFSTPLLCESQLCAPVTDEVILDSERRGKQANFIHVEEFLPGPDLAPPAATFANQSAPFKAWKLQTEPWVFVIDGDGVIRAKYEGPVTAGEIDAALAPLL